MKLLIFLLAIFVLATADWEPRSRDEFLKDRDECFKSENISEHCIDEIKRHVFPDEPKCFFQCLMKKNQVWDDTIGYDVEKAYKELTIKGNEVTKEDLRKCSSDEKKDKDSCVWANNVVKCLWEKNLIKWRKD